MPDDTTENPTAVGELRTVPESATELGVTLSRVHQLISEGALLCVTRDGVRLVPADCMQNGQPLKGLRGVVTLLRDAQYTEAEVIGWLYSPDDSLPGAPVQALRENRGTEVRRRAQAIGF